MGCTLLGVLVLGGSFPTIVQGSASVPLGVKKQERKRLDRANLLEYRQADGKVVPVRSVQDWKERRKEIIAGAIEVMGSVPGPAKRVALDIKVEDEKDFGSYVRRRITYQAEPGSRVPAHLFIPKAALNEERATRAGVLCLMGTGGYKLHDIDGASKNTHDGERIAERGMVAIGPAYPILGMGARSGLNIDYVPKLKELGYESGTMKAIWDNMRALDVLESLPYVKRSGFGVIGHSLGGHNAICTSVFEERIKVIVASCGFDSYLDFLPHMWVPGKGWSQEVYMPKIMNYPREEIPFDFYELIGSLAPRPLFVNAPTRDSFFPKWGSVAKIIASASMVYRLHNVPDLIRLEQPDLPHDFPPEMRERCYDWIEQFL